MDWLQYFLPSSLILNRNIFFMFHGILHSLWSTNIIFMLHGRTSNSFFSLLYRTRNLFFSLSNLDCLCWNFVFICWLNWSFFRWFQQLSILDGHRLLHVASNYCLFSMQAIIWKKMGGLSTNVKKDSQDTIVPSDLVVAHLPPNYVDGHFYHNIWLENSIVCQIVMYNKPWSKHNFSKFGFAWIVSTAEKPTWWSTWRSPDAWSTNIHPQKEFYPKLAGG